jgi:hypothetical protein
MLHSSFVTQNYINTPVSVATLPTVTYTPIDLRPANTDGTSLDGNASPGYSFEGMKWEIWDWVFVCGAGASMKHSWYGFTDSSHSFPFVQRRWSIRKRMRRLEALRAGVGMGECNHPHLRN